MHDDRLKPNTGRPGAGAAGCPTALELAAFLDGRLEAEAAERVEAHLAECPDCLAAVSAVREVVAAGPTEVPPAVVEAAQGLVQPTTGLGSSDRSWWTGGGLPAAARWITAAAAVIAVCLAGYHFGTTSPVTAESIDLSAEMSFGLLDGEEAERIELLAFASGEVTP